MKFTWAKRSPFIIGTHTHMVCDRIDRAINDYRNGKSTYLMITEPYRHGKTDLVSRYLPPHYIGEFPQEEVMVGSYNSSLVHSFSRFARSLVKTEKYATLYPKLELSKEEHAVDSWAVGNRDDKDELVGHLYWSGIQGTLTGKGFSLGILDDVLKNREEAESETIRDKIWDSFSNDFMTRGAPIHIVIVMGTSWHVDDIFGRIRKKMEEDDNFPRFEDIVFPAFDEGKPVRVMGKEICYKDGVLFPERFPPEWYKAQKSAVGPYGYASLLQGRPQLRGGKVIRVDKITDSCYYDTPPDIFFTRGWDLASTEKQRTKDDPDFTAGIKLGVTWAPTADEKIYIPTLYIDDLVDGQWNAPKRQEIILNTTMADGPIPVGVEAFGPYKDAFDILEKILKGVRSVKRIQLAGDKLAKWSVLEPPFEAGNVRLRRAPWNARLLKQISDAPAGLHDDYLDALTVAFSMHAPWIDKILKHYDPSARKNVDDFKLNWSKAAVPQKICLHYASVSMTPDMVLHLICAVWDEVTGTLYIYHAESIRDTSPDVVIPGIVDIAHLREFWFEKFLASSAMVNDDRSLARVYNKQFAKLVPNQEIKLREPRHYDPMGALALSNHMINEGRLVIHNRCRELAINLHQWQAEGGKVKFEGLREALMMLISELDSRHAIRPHLFQGALGDYKVGDEAHFAI